MFGGGMEVGSVWTRLGFKVDDGQANAYDRRVAKLRRDASRAIEQEVKVDADTSGIDRYQRRVRQADKETGRLAHTAGRTARGSVGALGRTVSSTAGLLGVGGLATGLALAGRELVGFDKAMRNVNSIAGLNEKELGRLTDRVKDLAVETGQMPTTLAEGLYDLVSSGFDAGQSMKILRSTAKAATAGLTDTATSTKAVAAVLNAYQLKASDAAAVSDDLFQTVNAGVVTFPELAQNIGDVLPFASALNVGLKEVGAATATMTKAGVSAPETMTRIKAVLSALISPSEKLKGAYDDLGVASGEELIKKTGSLQGALVALTRHVGDNKTAVAELFPDIRGLGGALLLTGKNTKGAAADLRGFKNDAGATQKALDEQSKSAAFGWAKAKAAIAAAVDDLQGVVAPAINDGSTAISKFIQEARKGEGQGGQVVDTMKRIAEQLRDAAVPALKVGRAVGSFVADNPELAKAAASFAIIGAGAKALAKVTGAGKLLKIVGFGRGNNPAQPLYVRDVLGGRGGVPGAPGGGGPGRRPPIVPPWVGPVAAGAAPAIALQQAGVLDKRSTRWGIPQTDELTKFNRKLVLPGLLESGLGKLGIKTGTDDLKRFGDQVAKVQDRLDRVDGSRLRQLRDRSRELEDQFPKSARALRAFARDVERELNFRGAVGQIDADWNRITSSSTIHLRDIRTLTRDEMRNISSTLGKKSLEGKIALARNFQNAIGAVRAAMKDGTVSTRTGMAEIRKLMLEELALFGIKGQAARNYLRSPVGDTAGKGHGAGSKTTYATGGWVGQRGQRGADTIVRDARDGDAFLTSHHLPLVDLALASYGMALDPLLHRGAGGASSPVLAGAGEAHVPRESVPIIDRALRGRFGASLDDLFDRIQRPHSMMAAGGIVDRVAALGRSIMARGPYTVSEHPAFGGVTGRHATYPPFDHYSGGSLDVNADGAPGGEAGWLDRLAAWLRAQGWHVLWRVADHYDHLHVDASGGGGASLREPKLVPRQLAGVGGALGAIVQRGLDLVQGKANERIQAAATPPPEAGETSGTTASPAQVRSWLTRALRITGHYTASNLRALEGRTMQESGGNPRAVNTWDSNAKKGTPSKGLLQTIEPTFNAHKLPGHGDIFNPVDNAIAAIRYMIARYGHIVGPSSSGYSRGGRVTGLERFASGGKKGRKRRRVSRGFGAGERPGTHERTNRGIARSLARAEKGIAPFESRIQRLERDYDQLDRQFDRTDEAFLVENEDGSATVDKAAVDQRLAELDQLKAKREQIRRTIVQYRRAIERAITAMVAEVQRLRAAIKASPGKARTKRRQNYRTQLDEVQARITELDGTYRDLGEDATDATLDLGELADERAAVAGTSPVSAPVDDPSPTDPNATDTAPPTPLDIAKGVAEEFAKFTSGRAELFEQFGRNAVPGGQVAALFSDPAAAAAGARYFGAVPAGPAGALQGPQLSPYAQTQQAAGMRIEITNNFQEGPVDPHTWAQQQRFQIEGAMG